MYAFLGRTNDCFLAFLSGRRNWSGPAFEERSPDPWSFLAFVDDVGRECVVYPERSRPAESLPFVPAYSDSEGNQFVGRGQLQRRTGLHVEARRERDFADIPISNQLQDASGSTTSCQESALRSIASGWDGR